MKTEQIDKYKVVSTIGEGASGVVHLVEHAGSKYALKLFKSSDDASRIRFRRESATLVRISHENLVKIFDAGEYQGFPYLVMEYIKGKPLDSALKEQGKLDVEQSLQVTRSVVGALNELNKQNLVHRDVKPANILISENNVVKVIDLGLVGDLEQIKEETEFVGTPIYSSPEKTKILKRPVDFSSDLYSVGVTLFECLTGQAPFNGTLSEILQAHASKVAPDVRDLNPDVPPAVSHIIKKLLAKDPDDRYRTAVGLLFDLDSLDALDKEIKAGKRPVLGSKDRVSLTKSFKFVERKAEVDQLKSAWRRVQAGAPECDIVIGESGSGKSRICEAFIETLDRNDSLVLSAKCQPFDRDLPFGPLREAFGLLVQQAAELQPEAKDLVYERLRKAAHGFESHVHKLFDSLKSIVEPAKASAEVLGVDEGKDAFFKGIAGFISNLANEWPSVVLYIDDVQWLDQSSLSVLKTALELSKGKKFLFLGTSRNDQESAEYLAKTKDKFQSLLKDYIEVKAFTLDQIDDLLKQRLGASAIDPVIPQTIFTRSKGSPFIAIEYLRACIEQGFLVFRNAQWNLDKDISTIQLSVNVFEMIMKRVDGCSPRVKDFLSFAAVYGNGFSELDLAEAMEVSSDMKEAIIREIQPLDLIEPIGGKKWRFSHDKIPESLKGSLEKGNFEDRCEKLSELLARKEHRTTDEMFVLARLYMQGRFDKNVDHAIRALIEAGTHSVSSHAHEEGFSYLKFAVDKITSMKLSRGYLVELAAPMATCSTILGKWTLARKFADLALSEAKTDAERIDRLSLKVWSLKNEGDVTAAWEYFKIAYETIVGKYPLFLHWKLLVSFWYWFLSYALDLAESCAPFTVPVIARLARLNFNPSLDLKRVANLYSDSIYIVLIRFKFVDLIHLAFQLNILGHLKRDPRTLAMGHSCIGYALSLLRLNKLAAWHFEKSLALGSGLEDQFLMATLEFRRLMGRFHGGLVNEVVVESEKHKELFENYLNPMELSTLISTIGYELMERGRYDEALPYILNLSSGEELTTGKASILNEIHARNRLWVYHKMMGNNHEYLESKKAALQLNNEYRFWAYVFRGAALHELHERNHLGYLDEKADELLRIFWPRPGVHVDQFALLYNIIGTVHVLMNQFEAACRKTNGRGERLSVGRTLRIALRFMYVRLHTPQGRAVMNFLTGRYFQIRGDYSTAEQYYRIAEEIMQQHELSDQKLMFELLENRARIQKANGRTFDLASCLQMALNIAVGQNWKTKVDSFLSEFKQEFETIPLLRTTSAALGSSVGETSIGTVVTSRMAKTVISGGRSMERSAGGTITSKTAMLGATQTSQGTSMGAFGSNRYLEAFLEISSAFTSSIDPVEQSRNVLSQIVKLFAAERGFVFVQEEGSSELKPMAGKNASGEDLFELKGFSNTVVKKTFTEGKPVILTGTDQAEVLGAESAVLNNLRSIMATPLISKDKTLGVVYLDSSLARGLFTNDDIDLFSTLANYISVAFELSLMAKIELDKVNLQRELDVQSAVALEAKKVQVLVDNMEQALFSVDSNGNIVEPVSKYSSKVFGKPIVSENVWQNLFKDLEADHETSDRIKTFIQVVFGEDELQWSLMEDSLPRKLSYSLPGQKSTLRVHPSPLWDDAGLLERILFVVEDITQAEILEKRAAQQSMETAIIEQLVTNELDEVGDFMTSTSKTLETIRGKNILDRADRAEILRDLHTLKGNSRLFGFSYISKQIHESETALLVFNNEDSETKPDLTLLDKNIDAIQAVIELYAKGFKKIRSSDSGGATGVSSLALEGLVSLLEALIPKLKAPEADKVKLALERLSAVPIKDTLKKFERMVTDIAEQLKKDVQFEVTGDALLDRERLRLIQECCLHLIRNSLDHGLEDKAERVERGKSEKGKIRVHCTEDSGHLNISIEDDGRGIDGEVVARKAVEKAIIQRADAEKMSMDEKVALIFAPNFSTKDSATDISGRGIGMDVVKKNIEDLGGRLKIDTEKGRGSKFLISIPLVAHRMAA